MNINITSEIAEFQEYYEVIDDDTFFSTGTMEMTTNETVENKITEHQLESE